MIVCNQSLYEQFKMRIQIIMLYSLLCCLLSGYEFEISMNTDAATVSDFRVDLGECSCDLLNVCDNFCCCDSACEAKQVQTWNSSGWCRGSGVQIQKFCDNLSQQGYSSFQDLGCVVHSNRAAIGNFYNLPDTSNVILKSTTKFSDTNTNFNEINHGVSTPSQYGQGSIVQITLDSTQSHLKIWKPSAGSSCAEGFTKISDESEIYECIYSVQSQTDCEKLNAGVVGDYKICKFANCNETIDIATPTASTFSAPSTCNNAIVGVDIEYTLGYQNNQYKIVSGSITFSTAIVSGKAVIKTTITVTKEGTQQSGNPGYLLGSYPLQLSSGSLKQITAADGSCLTTSTADLTLNFGVNQTFTCLAGTNPCGSTYYIDSLYDGSLFKIRKYAIGVESVGVFGLTENTCSKQRVILNIFYSDSGWVMDPQYYVLGAIFTAVDGVDPAWTQKSLEVRWKYIASDQITAPPTNNFYHYFSLLWTPLQSKYSEYLTSPMTHALIPIALLLMITIFI